MSALFFVFFVFLFCFFVGLVFFSKKFAKNDQARVNDNVMS